jgi:hypothetical protein
MDARGMKNSGVENSFFTLWIHRLHPHLPMLSYKASGCNKTNPPCPSHCNIMFNVLVFGCGWIPPGDWAAALFNRVYYKGKIWPAGGFDTLAESQWVGQNCPSIPVEKFNNTTINCWVPGWSMNRSCNGKAAMFVATEIRGNIWHLGGGGGMTNWWPDGPFQWVHPLVLL